MTATSPKAFMLSAALHGAAAALLAWLTIVASRQIEQPKVFELVAGEGDNYGANVAAALGVPGGVKLDVPQPDIPAPKPEPVKQEAPPPQPRPEPPPKIESAPVQPPPEPVLTPAPMPKQDTKKAPDALKQPEYNFKKQIQRTIIRADSKAKKEVAKERAAEAKRLEEEKKRLTKEQFDQMNKSRSSTQPTTKVASSKGPRIDAEGIAKGVVGGSTENKVGGAGGKALSTNNDDVLGAYFQMFKQRLRERFEPPPGLSDSLKVTVEVRSLADGSFSSARVARSSGSREFDQAVLDAIKRVRMPARPDKKSETVEFVFSMRDANEG